MIYRITPDVYRDIRQYGGFSLDEVAAAINRKRQTPWRWEHGEKVPSPEQEQVLVEMTKLTIPVFGEIVGNAMTKLTDRPFIMGPSADLVPSVPLARAARQYSLCFQRIDPATRERIEELLRLGRSADADAEQISAFLAREVIRLIEKALGESLSDAGRE